MGAFLESERLAQTVFKRESGWISEGARGPGAREGRGCDFCLPVASAAENLFEGTREKSLDHFEGRRIGWREGGPRRPSEDLCSSQVAAVNFLAPFMDEPDALTALLKPLFAGVADVRQRRGQTISTPGLDHVLPVDDSGVFVDFEESGAADYLGEAAASSVGTAGVDRTSADAVVKFVREDGATQVVLIDWKYAESYGGEDLRWFRDADGDPATDRASIYRAAWERDAGPIEKALFLSEAGYEDLFVEPFYGFMRLQLLAAEMERSAARAPEGATERGADIVSCLVVAPDANADFRRMTSPKLGRLGTSPAKSWRRIVGGTNRFASASTEELFRPIVADPPERLELWALYVGERYLRSSRR